MVNFFEQPLTNIQVGDYQLEAPESHILVQIGKKQPYRDLCVGISAKYLSEKYQDSVMIDVGANIGDTAAMIASFCKNKMILVEASDYFLPILRKNILNFPNDIIIKEVFISDGNKTSGILYHWGGTAFFQEKEKEGIEISTKKLEDIIDENTSFIKIDTDGFDFKILLSSIDWLSKEKPGIIFENQIRNKQELDEANEVYKKLSEIGYKYFTVWDDPGYHLLSTTSFKTLMNLNRYLFKVWENKESYKTICNYDVLCLHERDWDVNNQVYEYFQNY